MVVVVVVDLLFYVPPLFVWVLCLAFVLVYSSLCPF